MPKIFYICFKKNTDSQIPSEKVYNLTKFSTVVCTYFKIVFQTSLSI